jgi:hypothetical protein
MLERIRAAYRRLPNPVKAAIATGVATFTGLFVPAFLGWTNDVLTWISDFIGSGGDAVPFPDPSVLTKAAVAAAGAAVAAVVNYAYRKAQELGLFPGSGPSYPGTSPPA